MFYASPNFCGFLSVMAQAVFFEKVDEGVERHCHNAQDDDGHEEPIHLEYLAGVDNKIPKPVPCRQKFPDDNSHKAQPAEVGACAPPYCLAGRQQSDHYHCRDVRRHLRQHLKPVQQFRHRRPGQSQSHLT